MPLFYHMKKSKQRKWNIHNQQHGVKICSYSKIKLSAIGRKKQNMYNYKGFKKKLL